MSSKRFLRRVLLSSCCFSAAALVSALPAAAADFPVTSGTQSVTSPITGTDTLTKTGSGTYIVTAANTSTGTTTISAGTLQIGTTNIASSVFDTTAAIASTSIVDNGTLVLNRGDGNTATTAVTYAGVISGTGALKQIGYGTVILTGNNTYTGATTLTSTTGSDGTIYSAVLQLGNGGTTGWIASTSVVNGSNSQLIFDRSDNVTWSGVISSSGAVTQLGTGTLTFTGANTYTGATTITNGALVLSGAGTFGASSAVTNNGIFDFSAITATGLTIKSLAGTATTAVVNTGAKNLTLTSGSTYAGTITGTGTFTISGGTEILTADSSGFTGAIVISGGTLQYGSSSSAGSLGTTSTAITDNGTLSFSRSDTNYIYNGVISGTGAVKQAGSKTLTLNAVNTYTGLTTVSSGVLQIGDSSHTTAKVSGAVTVSSSGTLTGYGSIGGNLTNAGTVLVGNGAVTNMVVGGTYTQTGTLTSEISTAGSSVLTVGGAATLAGKFTLTAETGSYGQFAYNTPILTASSVSGAFTTYSGVSGDVAYGVTYPSTTEVDALVVPKTSGQVYGDVITETLENTHVMNDIAVDHAAFDRCNDRNATCRGWSTWVQGFGGTNHVDAGSGAEAFNGHSYGVIGGLGYTFSKDGSLNLAAAYTTNRIGVAGGKTAADTDGFFAALTLHAGGSMIGVDLNGFYLANKSDISRDAGLSSTATSSMNNTGGGFTFQVTAPLLGGDLTPLAKVAYAFVSYGPFTETGAGNLNLQGIHGEQTTAYYDAGVRLSHVFTTESGLSLKPHAYVGAQVNGTEGVPDVTMSLINFSNTSFNAPAATLDKFSGVLKLGLDAKLDNALSLQADFNGKFGSKQQQAIFSLGASYRF